MLSVSKGDKNYNLVNDKLVSDNQNKYVWF